MCIRDRDQSVAGLSIAVMVAPMMSKVCEYLGPNVCVQPRPQRCREPALVPAPTGSTSPIVQKAAQAVVTVRVGSRWGSGVVVSASGYVLTNGHVLRAQSDKTSSIQPTEVFVDSKWHSCNVISISVGWMDVALLKLESSRQWPFLPIQPACAVQRGQPVFAIGSGLFCPRPGCSTQALTRGVICKVVHSRGFQVMLQSSELVHQGASGGALVDIETGCFVGLITSNARHISVQIIPQINCAMPVSCLSSLVTFLEDSGDSGCVMKAREQIEKQWSVKDQDFSDVWNLEPPPFDVSLSPSALEEDQPTSQPSLCLLYTSPSPRDRTRSRMPSSA
eukprot:TRINITY_DN50508_c0_g1_i1.p1 TRINITY_DN50508_c0_g1~~TRINITY_DN50508_c0_g1_i1.p1  ORF type:complete len:334 (-),score=17.78 TRINITY_DN50508_c0_g1_i1:57-1058(-)